MQKVELHTEVKSGNVSPACSNAVLGAVQFKSHQAHFVNCEFEKHFGIKFQSFWLGWVIGFDNQILIDLSKFDNYLTEKYNYNGSMSDFILTEFGQSAHDFLKRLI